MLPNYTDLRLLHDAARSEGFVLDFRRSLVQRQMKEQKVITESTSTQVIDAKRELFELVHSNLRFESIMVMT